MQLYRITRNKYGSDTSGSGGLFTGGRWHRQGTPILYTSDQVSLAKLEILANYVDLPANMVLVEFDVPDSCSILQISPDRLPTGWNTLPYRSELADITEDWIQKNSFWIMRVPSVHSPKEFNYLLNPLHPEHQTLKISNIEFHSFDPRLK